MTRSIIAVAALAASLFARPARAAMEVCNTDGIGLNFRSAPSVNAHIQTAFPDGHHVISLGRSSGQWKLVQDPASGRTGWMFGEWLSGGGGTSHAGGQRRLAATETRPPRAGLESRLLGRHF